MGNDYHNNRGNDFGGQNQRMDYYSQDAKLQRKAKRRKVYPDGGGDEIRFDDHRVRSDYGASSSRAFEARRKGPGYQGPGMLTLLLMPFAGLHFCVGSDFVTPTL
jgi:hypothetical protein